MNDIIIDDCLMALNEIPSKSVDLIITSPPYNLGNKHHTENKRHNPYDDDMPEPDYQDWQVNVLNECFRVLKDDGSMFYNHKNRIRNGLQITPYEWIFESEFLIKQELIWVNGSPNFDKIRFYPHTERIYWLVKDSRTKLINTISHNDVFNWSSVGIKGVHTRAFPEKMVEDIMACFPDSKVVLDPFAGSGTVGAVCQKLGKEFILIEKEEKYGELMKERLIER